MMELLISPVQLQKFLKLAVDRALVVDGIVGPATVGAARDLLRIHSRRHSLSLQVTGWNDQRVLHAATQVLFRRLELYDGDIDGLVGPNTLYALEKYQDLMRDDTEPARNEEAAPRKWPNYSEMLDFYGKPGTRQKRFNLPYTMRLAWDKDVTLDRVTMHEKCGGSAMHVLDAALRFYGKSGIRELGLDMFGGTLNIRKMRGGTKWSVHSWGAAIDIDPENNQFRWTSKHARMAGPQYDKWWSLWEEQGWVSLGRARNMDWMHVQACRL